MLQKKVYISSTFRDLIDHREKVIDFFQKFPDKFDLVAMENYVAEAIPPVDKCVQDVMECDIYILLLANRYGFIPDGSKQSVTETEYETARKSGKQILAFFAADVDDFPPDTDGDIEYKKQRLAQFKKSVQSTYLTHPEAFISPDSLTVQVSESLMKKLFLDFQVADQRKLCCDRSNQYGEYLRARSKNAFKTFLIYGHRKELGRNMINRFLFFTLHTGIKDKLPYHLTTDFITNDYEKSKTNLVVGILEKDLHVTEIRDTTFEHLITIIDERPFPTIVLVIECSISFLRDEDLQILATFLNDFNVAYKKWGKKEVYLFLNIEDDNDDEQVCKGKISALLQCNSTTNEFVFCLPRLKRENWRVIDQWISTYLTGDQTAIDQILENHFSMLMQNKDFTMSEAEISIQKLLKKINARDSELLEILNL